MEKNTLTNEVGVGVKRKGSMLEQIGPGIYHFGVNVGSRKSDVVFKNRSYIRVATSLVNYCCNSTDDELYRNEY